MLHNLRVGLKYDDEDDVLKIDFSIFNKYTVTDEYETELIKMLAINLPGFSELGNEDCMRDGITIWIDNFPDGKRKRLVSLTLPFYPGNYCFEEISIPLIFHSQCESDIPLSSTRTDAEPALGHEEEMTTFYLNAPDNSQFIEMHVTGCWVKENYNYTLSMPGQMHWTPPDLRES